MSTSHEEERNHFLPGHRMWSTGVWQYRFPRGLEIIRGDALRSISERGKMQMAEEDQHDDHIWLTVGGESWAICFMHWPYMVLWRGFAPNLEFSFLDMSEFNPEAYHEAWLRVMEQEYGWRG